MSAQATGSAMQTVWQLVAHEPVWVDGRCTRCGGHLPGRAIHDPDYGHERGEYVAADHDHGRPL